MPRNFGMNMTYLCEHCGRELWHDRGTGWQTETVVELSYVNCKLCKDGAKIYGKKDQD